MWKAFYLSFYSKDIYRDVAHNWRGLGFTYLFVLVFISTLGMTLTLSHSFKKAADAEGQELIRKMPVMTFKDSKLIIREQQPYRIYLDGNYHKGTTQPKEVIIFDNTDKVSINDLYPEQVLVTDEFIHVRTDNQIKTFAFKDMQIPDATVSHGELQELLNAAKRWFMPIFLIFMLLFMFLYRIIQMLIYGLFGLLFNRIMKSYLEYPQLVRIAVMAVTPVILIESLILIAGLGGVSGWVAFLVTMGFMIFGIRANKELIS